MHREILAPFSSATGAINLTELEEMVEDWRFELTATKAEYKSPNQDLLKCD